MVYLAAGQINLHKSNVCGGDFVRYLHALPKIYRLSEYGDVLGMDQYGVISRSVREKQLLRLKQNARKEQKANRGKQPINAHSKEFSQNKIVQLVRDTIPDDLDTPFSSLWNMDLHDSLMPFANAELPAELLPTDDEVITLNNVQFNLGLLDERDKRSVINTWQRSEHIDKRVRNN